MVHSKARLFNNLKKSKMNPKHLVVSESKDVLKKIEA